MTMNFFKCLNFQDTKNMVEVGAVSQENADNFNREENEVEVEKTLKSKEDVNDDDDDDNNGNNDDDDANVDDGLTNYKNKYRDLKRKMKCLLYVSCFCFLVNLRFLIRLVLLIKVLLRFKTYLQPENKSLKIVHETFYLFENFDWSSRCLPLKF